MSKQFIKISGWNNEEGTEIRIIIDTGTLSGGGILFVDPENNSYSGVLDLKFSRIGLVAIGLFKQLSDSSEFSLLAIITASFNPPVTLPFNFNLSAVGGLFGSHRSMNVDYLRAGLKEGTLDSILFPQNPLQNAPIIFGKLDAGFAPVQKRYIVGPMAKIGWGVPQIIRAEIGIFIEIPNPVIIAVLGKVTAILPSTEITAGKLIEINLDVLGVLDLEKKSFSLDATLYNSRILSYSLQGDMAMRLLWGSEPYFLISIGGFHPKFKARPGTPVLRRLSLPMGAGDNPRIVLECYLALTSNSAQFGAMLELTARKLGFRVHGYLYFDALFIFSPFSFFIDMGAGLGVYKGSKCLLAITLDFSLSGPTPWRAKGKAKFKVLLISVSVGFDVIWGRREAVALPASDPWPLLEAALKNPDNWKGVLPDEKEQFIHTREFHEDKDLILIHPLGRICVSQNVLPFKLKLQKFGNAVIHGFDYYEVKSVNDQHFEFDYEKDFFAMSQFVEMTDAEKLSRPSFEKQNANIIIGSENIIPEDEKVDFELNYKTSIIDGVNIVEVNDTPRFLIASDAIISGRAGIRNKTASNKFYATGMKPLINLKDEAFVLASLDNMQAIDLDGNCFPSYAEANQALDNYIENNPDKVNQLQIVNEFELS